MKRKSDETYPYPRKSTIDAWRKGRYKLFNEKIDAMKDHPKYQTLRENADKAIQYNEGGGYTMIVAADFIEKIESSSIETIRDWLDGKIQLKLKEKENNNDRI